MAITFHIIAVFTAFLSIQTAFIIIEPTSKLVVYQSRRGPFSDQSHAFSSSYLQYISIICL